MPSSLPWWEACRNALVLSSAFVLRALEGLEIAEIARILRCRQSTVRSNLCMARRALRDIIENEFPELLER